MASRATALVAVLGLALPPVTAAQSGVLLGLHTGSEYRTLWIADDGDTTAVLASGPGLLVPRTDGFWRVDVIAYDELADILVAGPTASWSAAADTAREEYVPFDTERCLEVSDRVEILFLSPDYLSSRRSSDEGGCAFGGPRPRDEYVVAPLDPAAPPLSRVLDSSTSASLDEALRVARDSVQAEELARDSTIADDLVDCHQATWGVRRGPGRWVVAGVLAPYSFVCLGAEISLPLPPPRVVVGETQVPVHLDRVRQVVPGARDAVASPRRDMIIALTRDSLYLVRLDNGRLRPPTLVVRIYAQIVMAEWAFGRHVRRWTNEVRALLRPEDAKE